MSILSLQSQCVALSTLSAVKVWNALYRAQLQHAVRVSVGWRVLPKLHFASDSHTFI